MQLYFNTTSPFARKARVAVHEVGLEREVSLIEVDPWAEPAALTTVNPLSKVPVLVLADGRSITESTTICEVLDLMGEKPRLVPPSGAARTETLARAALCQGLIDASFICILEDRRPDDGRWPAWVARQQRAIVRTLAFVETRFDFTDERFDLGDISLACALAYLDFRHPSLSWRQTHRSLAAWLDRASLRPSMLATKP